MGRCESAEANPRLWLLGKGDNAVTLAALKFVDYGIRHARRALTVHEKANDAGRVVSAVPLQGDSHERVARKQQRMRRNLTALPNTTMKDPRAIHVIASSAHDAAANELPTI
jgi:hypothetical protein